jgi:hypothetical protein
VISSNIKSWSNPEDYLPCEWGGGTKLDDRDPTINRCWGEQEGWGLLFGLLPTIWPGLDENLIDRSEIHDEAYNWLGPAIRQSSVATAGRSVTAEPALFDGKFSL